MENIDLKIHCKNIRKNILKMVYEAKSGHIGGSFSSTELLTTLYFHSSNVFENFKNKKEKEDRIIISKAHISPLVYSILFEMGEVSAKDIFGFRKVSGILEGHVKKEVSSLLEYSGGSLGQGLSFACGMALSLKKDNKKGNVFCLLGDGEMQEGQNFEALLFASKYMLDNLCVIIDRNLLQIEGNTEDVLPLDSLKEKFLSFGFNVIEIDGHNFDEIKKGFDQFEKEKGKPFVVIANTIKGKGISFMENNVSWHGKAPLEEEYLKGIDELK